MYAAGTHKGGGGGACDQTRDWKMPLTEAMLKPRPSHLIAEGVLLGHLHHARALLAMHGVCVLLAKEGASRRWHCRQGLSHLVAEGVLLGRLHHARALPAQLRHQRLQLGRAHRRAVVTAAQPPQRDVNGTVRPGAPNACIRHPTSGVSFVWIRHQPLELGCACCCTVIPKKCHHSSMRSLQSAFIYAHKSYSPGVMIGT